jgi:hypothetical protein
MNPKLLHVVTAVSNPLRWKSRIRLARDAISEWVADGASVTVVECTTGERPPELDDLKGINYVRTRAHTVAWNKECLLNIGIARLPTDAEYIATLDADIHFRKRAWASETVQAMQLHPAGQVWSDCYDLGPQDENMQVHKSFCSLYVHGKPVIPTGPKFWDFDGGKYQYSHCLPGDSSVIPGGSITAASARPFEGNLVVIRTASGQELTCSPNHPVFSGGRWRRADELDVGDDVFRHVRGNGIIGKPHEKHTPTPIEDIVRSFRERSGTHRSTNTLPDNFDGNVGNGKVTEIWSNRNLSSKLDSELMKLRSDLIFGDVGRAAATSRNLFPNSGGLDMGAAMRNASACAAASSGNASAFFGRHLGHHALRNSRGDFPPMFWRGTIPGELSGERFSLRERIAGDILVDESIDRPARHADDIGTFIHALAPQIEADKIVYVGRRWFSGQLYDLQTEHGYIIADGLLTHNSGYGWFWRRGILDSLGGLLEICGMGSADHHMAYSLIGGAKYSLPGKANPHYSDAIYQWQIRALHHVNKSLGYVPQTIEHAFHGRKGDRGYISRWDMFLRHNFDPLTDLKRNSWGVIEFSGKNPELQREFEVYLRSRLEDGNLPG